MQKRQHVGPDNLLGLVAEDVGDGRVSVGVVTLRVDGPDPLVSSFDNRTEFFFTFFDCLFGGSARGDVPGYTLYPHWCIAGINQTRADFERDPAPVFGK